MAHSSQLERIESKARKEDVATIDGIIHAIYDVISGPAGSPRDWERERTLYVPGGLLVASRLDAEGKRFTLAMDVDGYIQYAEPRLKDGFYEYETHRVTRRAGNVTHVFSSYEARQTPGAPIIASGVNSIELIFAADRYWIVSIMWDAASGVTQAESHSDR